jgi:hypothetical protein
LRREEIMFGATLDKMVKSADFLKEVPRSRLQAGDFVFVKTCNSEYSIRAEQDGLFTVSGGWFDLRGKSPTRTTIRGCTWGGTAIKIDIVAACGLRIEFGNRLVTSPIQKIFVFSREASN